MSVATRDRALAVANEAGARLLHGMERFVVRSSLVPTTPFLAAARVRRGSRVSRPTGRPSGPNSIEVLATGTPLPNFQDISVDQASITDDDGWKTFFFFGYGFRSDANCERCPQTAALLDGIPGLTTAFFSILSPRKHIGAHRGPWRGVLRYHLALRVPEPAERGRHLGGRRGRPLGGGAQPALRRRLRASRLERHRRCAGRALRRCLRPLRPPADQLNRALICGHRPVAVHPRRPYTATEAWERRFEAARTASESARGAAGEPPVDEPPKPQADIFAKVDDPRLGRVPAGRVAGPDPLLSGARRGDRARRSASGGRQVVMLGSNNYLGLTTDPRVRAAAIAAVDRYGTGVTGSRLLNGTLALHRELEELLADWVGQESALVFTTGYAANLGLLGALVGPDDAAVVDSAAHASLVDGARFSEGTLRAFRHNRPNSLRRTLRSWREQPDAGGVLVAVDGIYSMEGDWAPLAEIAALCTDFGARLLVDEAHALGVVGPRGAGTAAAMGVRPDLIMGTFSKSLASCGGFIAGPAAGHRLSQGHLPPADVHGLGGARRPGRRPGSGPDRPGRGLAPGGCRWPGRTASGRAWPTSASASRDRGRAPSSPFGWATTGRPGCCGTP